MKKRWATFLAVTMLAGALIAPGAASASTTEAIADTGGMTLDFDDVASVLDVSITLDELGHITEVMVGTEPVEGDDDHRVRFSDAEDTTRVSVQAKNHKLAADVKAGALVDIVGVHVWSAPLFGSLEDTTVTFEVTDDGGNPVLVLGDDPVTTDEGVVVEVGEVKNETEGDEAESSVKITFTKDGYTMTLKIQASVESDDDDDDDDGFTAKLKIVLRGKDVQNLRRVALEDVAGDHTWDGHLCDGTLVEVKYNIDDVTGAITVAEVANGEVKTMPHGFSVKFDDSKAKVTVDLKEKEDGTWDLKVRSKSTDKCNPSDDKADKDRGNSSVDKDSEERGRPDKDKKNDDDDDDDKDKD